MAKTRADLNRRNLFNFYRLKKAIENQFNTSKGADQISLENSKKTGIKQLVRQFQKQQQALEQNNISP